MALRLCILCVDAGVDLFVRTGTMDQVKGNRYTRWKGSNIYVRIGRWDRSVCKDDLSTNIKPAPSRVVHLPVG